MHPKDALIDRFQGIAPPDFSQPDEPHGVLAGLPLPIYITTNYDSFMAEALKSRNKDVRREFCRWNNYPEVVEEKQVLGGAYKPTPAAPLVYHLHGHTEIAQSMVLTEGDYLDFLIRLSAKKKLLPPAVRKALAGTALLFVGYRLADWNFRVILRGLIGSLGASLGYPGISVQLPPDDIAAPSVEKAQEYLDKYLDQIHEIKVRIYWGKARSFMQELRSRWEARPAGGAA